VKMIRRGNKSRQLPASGESQISRSRIDRGTPQTRRRLRADVVDRLRVTGRIDADQLRAANEIHDIAAAWARVHGGGKSMVERIDSVSVREPLDRMTSNELEIWKMFYLPWRQSVYRPITVRHSGGRSKVYRGITYLALTESIVLKNMGTRQFEDRYGLPHGTAAKALSHALEEYAITRGWVS
jgi:hypothetical protein